MQTLQTVINHQSHFHSLLLVDESIIKITYSPWDSVIPITSKLQSLIDYVVD